MICQVDDTTLLRAIVALEDAANDCEAQANADYGNQPHPALKIRRDIELAVAAERREIASDLRYSLNEAS